MVGGRELMRSRELTLPKPFFPFGISFAVATVFIDGRKSQHNT